MTRLSGIRVAPLEIVLGMTTDVGKREAHKIETRRAIQQAADDLFASRGYAETTVRDIADAAGVTERTFFRYFPGKQALLIKDIEAWLPVLGDAIRQRPPSEGPLDAIEHTFLALLDHLSSSSVNLSWLFHDGPPGPSLEKSAPGLLLRFERVIADALADRSDSDDEFTHQVTARCAVAALRSAGIRQWQLRVDEPQDAQPTGPDVSLLTRAFATLRNMS
jgi:AcrR family transcriptional regulator